jgi:MFS family permease
MSGITRQLEKSRLLFITWSMVAAFGAYFCVYAFRKPFNAGTYAGIEWLGMNYKAVLIIAQVLGYMLSKFMGIKVISELTAAKRVVLIVSLILFAELSLLGFGLVPAPYNFVFLFLNGLPLGMVWGIVFSYLEGRRFTETLGMGLSISLIVSSGILKTIYLFIVKLVPGISEFWLPAFIGALFLPLFLFFVWMLAKIPPPSEDDKKLRVERVPMTAEDKKAVIRQLGWGIGSMVAVYTLLATLRDFRDNFTVEIWEEILPTRDISVFSQTELVSGVIVILMVGALSFYKSNLKGFWATLRLIAFGVLLCGFSSLLFQYNLIGPYWWMLSLGVGLFLAYIPIQVAVFERIIALFQLKANAGFFIYICDSIGYLGSVGLLLYKQFFMKDLQWSNVLMQFSYFTTVICLLFMVIMAVFFRNKLGMQSACPNNVQEISIKNLKENAG